MAATPIVHSKEEVLSVLRDSAVVAVATVAGEKPRLRMMHFAAGDDFTVYLATMKGDPKTLQITRRPAVSLLVHISTDDINDSREVEITGEAEMVHDAAERQRALEATALKSPVVGYLVSTGNANLLDCIKVVPQVVKLRIFREIVQGMPPTVVEFASRSQEGSDWQRLSHKGSSWLSAVRTASLTASLVPVLLGAAVAQFVTGTMALGALILTIIAAVAIQAGTNLFNDYFDHHSGNDEKNREFVRPFSGGSRVIQLGLLSSLEVLSGALLLSLLASIIGIYLAWQSGPFILLLGVVGLFSGVFYTGRPFRWASRGIGELMVGLNYGILMTLGAYYVQTQRVDWQPIIAALPLAMLIAAVLYINEFPDYTADRDSGKRTLVVRLGRRRAAVAFCSVMIVTYLFLIAAVAIRVLPASTLLALITLPLGLRAGFHATKHYADPFDLAPANAMTAISHLAVGLSMTLAFVWEGVGATQPALIIALAVVFVVFVGYMYRSIETQRKAFHGLKRAVG